MRIANPTARDLRRINRTTVLRTLYELEPLSRLDLSRESGLSTGTVTNVVTELLAEGLVLEAGVEASEGGRPRTLLMINNDYGYILGGEMGETDIHLSLYNLKLDTLHSIHYDLLPADNNPASAVTLLVEGVQVLLAQAKLTPDRILGLGLGVPGVVTHVGDTTVAAPAWSWHPVALRSLLSGHLSFPLYIENGSKTMALAELHSAIDRQQQTLAVLNLGTGVGAGIVNEGKLYRGATNSAGEWGHTIMALDGAPCRCGRRGCLEAYVGGPGIVRRLYELYAPDTSCLPPADDELAVVQYILSHARAGDAHSQQVLHEVTHYLGAGIANLVNLFNPQSIIVAGRIGKLLVPTIFTELEATVARYALPIPYATTILRISSPGRDDASLGSAHMTLEEFFSQAGKRTATTEILQARSKRFS